MASDHKVNYLKRTIKTTEKYMGTPLWKYFLIIFGVCTVMVGGLEIALEYKREVDMTSMSFISMLFAEILLHAVIWTAILRYFGQRDLKRLRRELDDIEIN